MSKKSISKTYAHWTLKHSTIGTLALIIVVASTHFYVVANEDVELQHSYNKLGGNDKSHTQRLSIAPYHTTLPYYLLRHVFDVTI